MAKVTSMHLGPQPATHLATPTRRQPLNLNAIGSGGSAISSHVRVRSMAVSCLRVMRRLRGPKVAASLDISTKVMAIYEWMGSTRPDGAS